MIKKIINKNLRNHSYNMLEADMNELKHKLEKQILKNKSLKCVINKLQNEKKELLNKIKN